MSDELTAPALGRLRLSQLPALHLDLDGDVAGSAMDWLPNQPAAASVSDDDGWRAIAVVSLLSGAVPRTVSRSRSAIDVPPVLVQFWDKGADVPHDVAECIASWEQLIYDVPGLTRVMFNDDTAREFIGDELTSEHVAAFDACRHPAMRCDYFRLCFLLQHGGFYVDADDVYLGGLGPDLLTGSDLKLQPLCYDVTTDEMVDAEVFLEAIRRGSGRAPRNNAANARDHRTRTHYINNNPLVAPAEHPVIRVALERANRLLAWESTDVRRSLGVQSTTGPGNLTAALVACALELGATGDRADVSFLENWDEFSVSRWPLEYRHDQRNWRLWNANQ